MPDAESCVLCPSRFVATLTRAHRPADADYTIQRMLLGTHTSDSEQNYLQIANIRVPRSDTAIKEESYDQDKAGASCSSSLGQP